MLVKAWTEVQALPSQYSQLTPCTMGCAPLAGITAAAARAVRAAGVRLAVRTAVSTAGVDGRSWSAGTGAV